MGRETNTHISDNRLAYAQQIKHIKIKIHLSYNIIGYYRNIDHLVNLAIY